MPLSFRISISQWQDRRVGVIEVRNLRKSYSSVQAVDGIDLSIEQGEIFAILGPNGAGKTTSVEILEGFRRRDSGEVRVLEMDPAIKGRSAREFRDRIGVVLQSTSDAGDLTVSETLRHFSGYYSKPRDASEVIESVGLEEKRDALIHTLSGGQRRRLDVGLGIIGNPELLFLDEPTTGFDPEARRSFWELIRTLREAGTTIVLTTHYLDEAEALADRVAVIHGGDFPGPCELVHEPTSVWLSMSDRTRRISRRRLHYRRRRVDHRHARRLDQAPEVVRGRRGDSRSR